MLKLSFSEATILINALNLFHMEQKSAAQHLGLLISPGQIEPALEMVSALIKKIELYRHELAEARRRSD